MYVEHLVELFREVRRVLDRSGTLWLVLGDSYASSSTYNTTNTLHTEHGWKQDAAVRPNIRAAQIGLKPKNLCGIPWRVAFALQADGWWLRQDVIWSKPNAMPESVLDRCTKAHEYVFLLSRRQRYYYDAAAIAEPCASGPPGNRAHRGASAYHAGLDEHQRTKGGLVAFAEKARASGWATRNRRSVWAINTKAYKEAHFATFPPELPRLCILAGSRPGDAILDPFAGAGTTGLAAAGLGRDSILIELNPDYCGLIRRRLSSAS
jgi:DNA modification methylase